MIIPSIKLNVFKKLEYFLVLKKLNKQFDGQISVLKSRVSLFNKESWKFEAAYPIWEIEKKILFWTYDGHKFIDHIITDKHFKDMLISDKEKNYVGTQNIFGNLEQRDFGKTSNNKTECIITSKGLSFGELLWYLYMPKECEFSNKDVPDNYTDIYKTNYILGRKSFGWCILQIQLVSVYFLIVYAVGFFTLEILNATGLLDNFKKYIASQQLLIKLDFLWIVIILLPFILFTVSFMLDFIYKWVIVDRKYEKIEKIRSLNKA
ncbi:MAG TPA: hypothetical protein DCS28_01390 [Candidatus Moranbacteria bacterium]|nr:hypothetical protein [Candidatus Moranbacteria bacterium]HAT74680.1 hypothetical protein [Candidatus Moranbacteria bacterium]